MLARLGFTPFKQALHMYSSVSALIKNCHKVIIGKSELQIRDVYGINIFLIHKNVMRQGGASNEYPQYMFS